MGRVNYRKPHLLLAAALFALTACGGGNTSEAGNTLKYDTRGLTPQEYSVANLIAADDYGRTVEVSDPSGAAKKYVGLFYFAWLGSQSMTGIYDVNKLEKLGDDSPLYDPNNTRESPAHQFHFASEPLYGYYSMKDPWVIARHVDNYFYKDGRYDDLWFRFDGDSRPVIVGVSTANGGATDQNDSSEFVPVGSEVYNYFNFYESQWPSSGGINQTKGFPWMQWGAPVPNDNGNASVSVIQHSKASVFASDQLPNSSRGYDGQGGKTEDWKKGSNFEWQWEEAFKYDAANMVSNIFVTGWNEWTAIKYRTGDENIPSAPSGYTGKDVWFVDNYNAEYSRDIEMGKEYGDGFYIQLVSNTRKFKTKAAEKYKMATKTISDLTDFSVWSNVFVEYADFAGDAMARDGENAANEAHSYVDNSNRNDITAIKVIHDAQNVYFYAETAEKITEYNGTDANWMNLFISAGDTENSFAGFNYVVNRKPGADGVTSVEKSAGGYSWTETGKAEYFVSGNKIVYKIPLSLLGLSSDRVELSFKITDNVQKPDDIMDYYVTGDSAPIGRFGYAYGK